MYIFIDIYLYIFIGFMKHCKNVIDLVKQQRSSYQMSENYFD